jgi:hypothetical protein
MNDSHVWFNLKDSHEDVEFADPLRGFLGLLQARGHIRGYRLTRRKFGFSPPELGDFHVIIESDTLASLDDACGWVAERRGELEAAHARVYSRVTDLRTTLYRDFPDPQRSQH